MRNIINISLPAETKKEVESAAKEENFASISEFFRHIWREYKYQQLMRGIRQSQKEIKAGKGKILHSLKDLD